MKPLVFRLMLFCCGTIVNTNNHMRFFQNTKKGLRSFCTNVTKFFLQTISIIPQVLCNNAKHKEYMQKTQVVLS